MSEKAEVIITPFGKSSFIPKWTRVYVRKSMDEICSYIEVDLDSSERNRIQAHDRIQVRYINDAMLSQGNIKNQSRPVATGFIDELTFEQNVAKKSFSIKARSLARDIIDSSWSDQYKNISLLKLTEAIAGKFSIPVSHIPTYTDGTSLIEDFSFEAESPWQKLIQIADGQGYIISSSQIGGIYVWTIAGESRPEPFYLEEGKEIISIKDHETGEKQFNKYIFSGSSESTKEVIDNKCNSKRILTQNIPGLTDEKSLNRRMQTELLRRRGRRINITVKRWGLSEDKILSMGDLTRKEVMWEINFLTAVKCPSIGIDTKLLVSQVEYIASEKEMNCTIELAQPEVYK